MQGWKENGDWPPKGCLEADAGVIRGVLGVEGKGRKGLFGGDGVGAGKRVGMGDEKGFSAESKLMGKSTTTGLAKRGVGRMKKVLGLGIEEKDKIDGGDAEPSMGPLEP